MTRLTSTLTATGVVAALLWLTVPARSQSQLSALPLVPLSPPSNSTTPERVELGRLLFWDPILSGTRDVACATCHHPEFGYAEDLDVSIGARGVGLGASRHFPTGDPGPLVKRNSQTVLNTGFNGIDVAGAYDPAAAPMFWDVRVSSLETQALEPLKALEEMRGDVYSEAEALDAVVSRLRAIDDYRDRFARAFGGPSPVTAENLGKAIAAFERTLVAANSPFDRYMRGDTSAMTRRQVQGMQQFDRAGCVNCHMGPMFSDFQVHVIGVPDNAKLPASDAGVDGRYAFRTASLRNLAYTAPYMHSGTLATLDDVVEFYDDVTGGGRGRRRGGIRNPEVSRDELDPLVRRLRLGRGRGNLVAFLQALSDDSFDRTIPSAVPSGLQPGGRIGN